jgi:predicted PurR-regulated permease PerM
MLPILLIVACFIPIFVAIFLCYSLAISYDELKRRNWRFTLRELLLTIAICSLVLMGYVLLQWFAAELSPKNGFFD